MDALNWRGWNKWLVSLVSLLNGEWTQKHHRIRVELGRKEKKKQRTIQNIGKQVRVFASALFPSPKK